MQAYCSHAHTASVNGVAFAPHELGLMLATASSDGSISILTYQAGQGWSSHKVHPPQSIIVILARELLNISRFCCTVAHFSTAVIALVSWDLTLVCTQLLHLLTGMDMLIFSSMQTHSSSLPGYVCADT